MISKFWTPARIAELLRLWREGETWVALALHFNMTEDAIKRAAKALKLPPRPQPTRAAYRFTHPHTAPRRSEPAAPEARACPYVVVRGGRAEACGSTSEAQFCEEHRLSVAPVSGARMTVGRGGRITKGGLHA